METVQWHLKTFKVAVVQWKEVQEVNDDVES